MGLNFEGNVIENFDVRGTFGTLNFLSVNEIKERDEEGQTLEEVREQRVTVYSSKLNDQVEVSIEPDYDISGIEYDDEIELTGHVTATPWLNMYGNDENVRSEQAFKVRAVGIRKAGGTKPIPTPPQKEEKKQTDKPK